MVQKISKDAWLTETLLSQAGGQIESFLCPICTCLVSLKATECINCNELFCTKCIKNWLKVKNTCPKCQTNFKQSEQPNRKVIDDLKEKLLKCAFCPESFKYKDLEKHAVDCKNQFRTTISQLQAQIRGLKKENSDQKKDAVECKNKLNSTILDLQATIKIMKKAELRLQKDAEECKNKLMTTIAELQAQIKSLKKANLDMEKETSENSKQFMATSAKLQAQIKSLKKENLDLKKDAVECNNQLMTPITQFQAQIKSLKKENQDKKGRS